MSASCAGRCAAGEVAEHAHENHREAENVEYIDAEKIRPGRVAEAEGKFLNAEEKAEAEHFRAAKNGLFGDGGAVDSLFTKALGDEREGNSSEKDEQRSGKGAEKVRPDKDRRFACFGAEPRIVAMRLEHEYAGEATHPVDVG